MQHPERGSGAVVRIDPDAPKNKSGETKFCTVAFKRDGEQHSYSAKSMQASLVFGPRLQASLVLGPRLAGESSLWPTASRRV